MKRSAIKLSQRIGPGGCHRILALDGGGLRGTISLAFLDAIEDLLCKRHGRNDYVLADYYDLIGGTSVGSLIATMLALGWPMSRVRATYDTWAPRIFGQRIGLGLLKPKFSERQLVKCLEQEIGSITISDAEFRTGLAIISKRVDTGSPWVVSNNPEGVYWNDGEWNPAKKANDWIANKTYRVADLIRASTAAPTYFHPKEFSIDERDEVGTFVDGGVSPYNSPALLLFMMAGVNGYKFNWALGDDKILITSVGTGSFRVRIRTNWLTRRIPLYFATESLLGVVADCQTFNLKFLQWLSEPRNSWTINSEVDDLRGEGLFKLLGREEPLLSFARYDVKLDTKWLAAKLGMAFPEGRELKALQALDNVAAMEHYRVIGSRAARHQVTGDDFPQQFNRPKLG
jgi:hypothetical protein